MKLLFKFFILGMIFLTAGCLKGTGSGNPLVPHPVDGIPGDSGSTSTYSARLRSNICILLSSCNTGLEVEDCKEGLSELTTYAPKLGISDPWTLEEIISAETEAEITPDTDAAILCDQNITAFNCGDSEVVGSYDESLANPFENSDQLLAPACEDVFK